MLKEGLSIDTTFNLHQFSSDSTFKHRKLLAHSFDLPAPSTAIFKHFFYYRKKSVLLKLYRKYRRYAMNTKKTPKLRRLECRTQTTHMVSRRTNPPATGGSPASLSRPELDDFVCTRVHCYNFYFWYTRRKIIRLSCGTSFQEEKNVQSPQPRVDMLCIKTIYFFIC